MTRFVYVLLIGLNFASFQCEGKITIKSDTIFFAPGENVVVQWNITNPIADLLDRIWIFTKTGEIIARIKDDGVVTTPGSSFSRVKVTKPSTLILENVNVNYNGTYSFEYTAVTVNDRRNISYVNIIMADKPNVTVCDSPIRVNTSKDVSCLCEGKGGNPPADVTWYNDKGDKEGVTEKEKNTLTLLNVDKTASGTYKCVAKSHTLEDEKSVEVIVNFQPTDVRVTFSPESVFPGDSIDITCEASGEPEPSFTIVINETQIFGKMYTLKNLNVAQKGLPVKCIAQNILGMDSGTKSIPLKETRPTPTPTPTTAHSPTKKGPSATTPPPVGPKPSPTRKPPKHVTALIVGIIIGVLGLIVIVIILFCCYKKKQKERHRGNAIVNSGNNDAPNVYESVNDGGKAGGDKAEGSTSGNPPANANPPVVYATVDKNRKNEPAVTYATLDTMAMQPNGSKRETDPPRQQTEYASIQFKDLKGDLV